MTLNKAQLQAGAQRQAIGFDAVGTLKRSDFGIDKLMSAAADEITLRITTEAVVPQVEPAK